jgi:hypothetical protein
LVEIKTSVVLTGIIGLVLIVLCMIIFDHIDNTIITTIVGIIALITGVIIPSPKVDNNKGVFKW